MEAAGPRLPRRARRSRPHPSFPLPLGIGPASHAAACSPHLAHERPSRPTPAALWAGAVGGRPVGRVAAHSLSHSMSFTWPRPPRPLRTCQTGHLHFAASSDQQVVAVRLPAVSLPDDRHCTAAVHSPTRGLLLLFFCSRRRGCFVSLSARILESRRASVKLRSEPQDRSAGAL